MARPGLDKNVKFRRLVKLLDEPRPHVRGYLECLWDVAYESGNARIGDSVAVVVACEYPHDPDKIVRALLDCGGPGRAGFIELVNGEATEYQIHDLLDHAPEYVQTRAAKEEERKRVKTCENCHSEFRSIEQRAKYCSDRCRNQHWKATQQATQSTPGNAEQRKATPGNGPPGTARSQPQLKKYLSFGEVCGEASSPPAAGGEVVMDFPIVGKSRHGATTWNLTTTKIAEYEQSFPGVDVLAECRKARQWCIDNPMKRKTESGMPAFLSRWLGKVQDSGGSGKNNGPRPNVGSPARIRSGDPNKYAGIARTIDVDQDAQAASGTGSPVAASSPENAQRDCPEPAKSDS